MQCKTCGKTFSRKVLINNKLHTLSTRVNCLECVPFKPSYMKVPEGELTCTVCKKQYIYKSHNNTRSKCGSCMVNWKRSDLKKKAVEYKGGRCIVCGYNRCHKAMDFHHIDSSQKDFTISSNHCVSWERMKAELDKCALLCRNCHAELHAGEVKLP